MQVGNFLITTWLLECHPSDIVLLHYQQDCVPTLVDLTLEDETGESVHMSSLQALTNLSITSQYHGHYTRLVQRLYELVDTNKHSIRLQALKVLVNLSTNPELVPHILAAKVRIRISLLSTPYTVSHCHVYMFISIKAQLQTTLSWLHIL